MLQTHLNRIFAVLIGLFLIANSLPNPAPYIYADNRPLNIAHRGLSSILPENTLQAFESALYQGADFIQLDVVYTKQKIPLVMHDPFLTRVTNIKTFTQFSTRYETRAYGGSNKTDWWTDTFSLNQLRKLGIKQALVTGRITIFDYKFTFPTLDEVIKMVIKFNELHKGKRNPDGRLAGILIEAKDSQMYRDIYGLEMGETILETLRKYNLSTIAECKDKVPIYLHSFDYGTIKYWASHTQLPRNYLLLSTTPYDLEDINKYATGLGFQDTIIWDYFLQQPTFVLQKTRQLGLIIHLWTFRDDHLLFEGRNNIQMYKIGQKDLKLDGIITQFCDVYAAVSQMLRAQVISEQLKNKKKQVVDYQCGRKHQIIEQHILEIYSHINNLK